MPWQLYKRGTIESYRISLAVWTIGSFLKHPLGLKHPKSLYINEGEFMAWGWDKKGMKLFWRALLPILKSPSRFKKYLENVDKKLSQARQAAARVHRFNLRKLSNVKLYQLFLDLENEAGPAQFSLNIEIDVFDLYYEDFLLFQIKKELGDRVKSAELNKIFNILIQPVARTYVNRQEMAMSSLAKSQKVDQAAIRRLYNRFWWTSLGWESISPHSMSTLKRDLSRLSKRKDLDDALEKILSLPIINKRRRNNCLKKYKLSNEIQKLLLIFDVYVVYHDKRKEVQVKSIYAFHLLLKEVSRRLHLKIEDLVWLWHWEIKELLKNKKFDLSEISRRRQCIVHKVSYQNHQNLSGRAASKVKKQIIDQKIKTTKKLVGVGVGGATISGAVKVCAGAKEALAKIKIGDILVCPMTLPEYVPAMKKAAAIITDEGGITCHAAIIARELNKPCVVGTKIATQVLRDGQRVSVDADRGLIKIIK